MKAIQLANFCKWWHFWQIWYINLHNCTILRNVNFISMFANFKTFRKKWATLSRKDCLQHFRIWKGAKVRTSCIEWFFVKEQVRCNGIVTLFLQTPLVNHWSWGGGVVDTQSSVFDGGSKQSIFDSQSAISRQNSKELDNLHNLVYKYAQLQNSA